MLMRPFGYLAAVAAFGLGLTLGLPEVHAEEPATAEQPSGEVEITQKARQHFKAGVNFLQDPDGPQYAAAYQQFKAAYAESPSWKILGNLGVAAMKLERDGEAIDAIKTYLEEGGSNVTEEERSQFQRDLETLQSSVAQVTLKTDIGAARVYDVRSASRGDDVKLDYDIEESGELVLRVRPGLHEFTVEGPDGQSETWKVSCESAKEYEHSFVLKSEGEKQPETAEPTDAASGNSAMRVGAYAAFGVGVVGVGLGTLFVIQRGQKKGDADDLFDGCVSSGGCGSGEVEEVQNLDKKAASRGTLSIVSFSVGAAAIGTGVALFVLSGGKTDSVEAQVGSARIRPLLSPQQLGLAGTF